ncbi:MAG: cytochrome c-type biogenesis protein CcmH [Candidatus Binatia bacterium]
MKKLLVAAFVFLAFCTASRAADSSPEVEKAARAIYADFMSPYCPGLLLVDCRSEAAVELRAEIHAKLAAGQSEAQVREELERLYGEKLRAAPAARGFGLLAWWTPFVVLLLAAGVAVRWVRANRAGAAASAEPRQEISPQRRARLDEELARMSSAGDRPGPVQD